MKCYRRLSLQPICRLSAIAVRGLIVPTFAVASLRIPHPEFWNDACAGSLSEKFVYLCRLLYSFSSIVTFRTLDSVYFLRSKKEVNRSLNSVLSTLTYRSLLGAASKVRF